MEKKNTVQSKIDFSEIWQTVLGYKKLFLKVWCITFVLSCVWILPQPRYYTTEVSIAPESMDLKSAGGLASLASSFGMNLGNGSSDAIYPQLYPDLFKSTNFLVGLFDIEVWTKDGDIKTDYYNYIKSHQKQNLLLWPVAKLKEFVKSLTEKKEETIPGKDGARFDAFRLTKADNDVLKIVQGKLSCTYSRTTDVVTIKVTDQDPLVSALLADSIKEHLQVFIADYRTKKSRIDFEHYKKLTSEAKAIYEKARMDYARYADAHQDALMLSVKTKIDDLENDMQLKYNVYTALNTRLEQAQAKVQETTPAFTTLTNATVPVKPAGPKRMIFVAIILILSTFGTIAYLFRKELKDWF